MTIFAVTSPMRKKQIGTMYCTLGGAIKAAHRSAKRLGHHVTVDHWREGKRATVFPDGLVIDVKKV